ncbi:hypothetical protein LOOC260_108020 [Paucilactobacillus hokkaidonensis JCM 18461]|uniref:Uncharacterized protein n=2 Tax=Paucilactobacillus hokkaidonensis TaxID=1193095 RepID=A0A0A1GSS5_9LACO|nr:hypothetical protein [Paucilactobacillus hokkaidonensis]KRO10145.1 hypothetical protein IV59_GL002166 [Paucilactobacillus hokkaidonensis]BAP85342.1 hypothetical protein LOOC260_108020 [Paucilactobacillus hokkaidonensis JCM 18461]
MHDSIEQGFEGYISLLTKTNGIEKYYLHLGDIQRTYNRIEFQECTSRRLVKKFYDMEG